MRIIFALLALGVTTAGAAEYFVAPDGHDDRAGTQTEPFATLQRAQSAVQPGDTVLIRGGTYTMRAEQIAKRTRLYAYVTLLDKSGTRDAPIHYRAFPGERPVFDFSQVTPPGLRVALCARTAWIERRMRISLFQCARSYMSRPGPSSPVAEEKRLIGV